MNNEYLADPANLQKVVAHNPKLAKKTTTEGFNGEAPVVEVDFNRSVERNDLAVDLGQYVEPDFANGNVKLVDVVQAVYGNLDDYVINRTAQMLRPEDPFNRQKLDDGTLDPMIFIAIEDGTIKRVSRDNTTDSMADASIAIRGERYAKTAATQLRGLEADLRKLIRINPQRAAALRARIAEGKGEIAQRGEQAILGDGE